MRYSTLWVTVLVFVAVLSLLAGFLATYLPELADGTRPMIYPRSRDLPGSFDGLLWVDGPEQSPALRMSA